VLLTLLHETPQTSAPLPNKQLLHLNQAFQYLLHSFFPFAATRHGSPDCCHLQLQLLQLLSQVNLAVAVILQHGWQLLTHCCHVIFSLGSCGGHLLLQLRHSCGMTAQALCILILQLGKLLVVLCSCGSSGGSQLVGQCLLMLLGKVFWMLICYLQLLCELIELLLMLSLQLCIPAVWGFAGCLGAAELLLQLLLRHLQSTCIPIAQALMKLWATLCEKSHAAKQM